MPIGIDGFQDDLRSPKLGIGGANAPEGPGAYDRLIRELRALADAPVLLEPLAQAWQDRAFETEYARPLLLLAAMRFRALQNREHPLALEVLMDAEGPDLAARLREALADPDLVAVLRARSVQTNEPGRAFAWGLTAITLGFGHRAFHLADLGCSAGLNLVVDRTALPFRFGMNKLAGFDFPSPERRLGLDIAPVDARDATEARWLEACIWPGQPERMDRFKACRAVYERRWEGHAPAPELRVHVLGQGQTRAELEALGSPSGLLPGSPSGLLPGSPSGLLPEALATIAEARKGATQPAGTMPVLAYESVVRPYLSASARAAHDADLWAFLEGGRERVWAVLEPSEKPSPSTPMTLTVHLVRGGQRHALPLAQSGYHASACVIVPGAPKQLTALWMSA